MSSADAAVAAQLARVASLPLLPERSVAAGEVLAAWLPAANELSRKMSAAEYSALLPVTVFVHAPGDQDS